MKLKRITKHIFFINFDSRRELASTFLRFQEHYESPKFKGKVFTLDEYKAWYIKNSPKGKKTRKFTYYSDWSGFNIPSYILEPFYQGKFDPLSGQEAALLKLFENQKGKFYIIASFGKHDPVIMKHEIAHGLYYADEHYRKQVTKLIGSIPRSLFRQICKVLDSKGGYHKDVYVDEAHAYILSEPEWLAKHGIPIKSLKSYHDLLDIVYKKHISKNS